MIIELKEGKITIVPMSIPEPASSFYVRYVFEPNTAHLQPRLTVGKREYFGDRVNIDLTDEMKTGEFQLKVDLLDSRMFPVHRYGATILHTNYSVFGPVPVRPDFFPYIHQLENEMEQLRIKHAEEVKVLQDRITELEERGEVI